MATTTALDQASPAQAPALKVAILGFGTVGSAVARILCDQPAHSPLHLTHVFNRDVERKRVDWVADDVRWSSDVEQVLASDADIIVELVGGIDPAYDWVSRALTSGKSVVTANKKLIAKHGPQLSALARQHGGALSFGASVAGGVPVIDALQEGLAGDRSTKSAASSTAPATTFSPSWRAKASPLPKPLPGRRAAGFAEADPTDDVDGYDARAKLVILTRIGLKAIVQPEQIPLRLDPLHRAPWISPTPMSSAAPFARSHGPSAARERSMPRSQPALVPIDSPMAHITGSLNLLVSSGQYGGQTAFSGHGAGGHSTAVAVVSDLLAIARGRANARVPVRWPHALPVSGNFASKHYLRFTVRDRPGIVAAIANALAAHQINIDALLQKPGFNKDALPFVVTLEQCPAEQLDAAMRDIGKLDFLVHRSTDHADSDQGALMQLRCFDPTCATKLDLHAPALACPACGGLLEVDVEGPAVRRLRR